MTDVCKRKKNGGFRYHESFLKKRLVRFRLQWGNVSQLSGNIDPLKIFPTLFTVYTAVFDVKLV